MNNFVKRTLSGLLFVLLIVGSILLSRFTFVAVFAVICSWTVFEFHKLTNTQNDVNVNRGIAVVGAGLLFITSFLYSSGILSYLVFSVYGLYFVLALIYELFRQKENPIHNWAYFLLGQVFIAVPFSLLNFILFIDA